MTDPSLYSFSDNFYQLLSQAMERPADGEEQYSEDQNPDTPDYQSSIDDLSSKYDEQSALIEQLQNQLDQYQSQGQQSNEPNYIQSDYGEDDPNYWPDFIQKNVLNDDPNGDEGGEGDNSFYSDDSSGGQETGQIKRSGTNAERHNNPGNLKFAQWEKSYGAVQGEPAPDGGYFSYFPDPQSGLNAQQALLKSGTYSNKTVDQAMKTYSNNGYDGSIYPEIKDKKMSELNLDELQELQRRQLIHEDNHYASKLGVKKYGGPILKYAFGGDDKYKKVQPRQASQNDNSSQDAHDLIKRSKEIGIQPSEESPWTNIVQAGLNQIENDPAINIAGNILKEKFKSNLANNLDTRQGYEHTPLESIGKVFKAGVLNIPEESLIEDPISDDASMLERDLFLKYLGKKPEYNTYSDSPYKPTKSKDKNAKYVQINNAASAFPEDMSDFGTVKKFVEGATNPSGVTDYVFNMGLGDYTMTSGSDDKGDYISYYDKWDLSPLHEHNNNANKGDESFGIGNPFEVYGRIYYDKKTGKQLPNQIGGKYKYTFK